MDDDFEIDWETWEPSDANHATGVIRQLKVEVGQKHQIFHMLDRIQILARDGATDDVLVSNPEDHTTVFIVHPTYAKTVETNPVWPATSKIKVTSVPARILR